jgi:hypothetical protein
VNADDFRRRSKVCIGVVRETSLTLWRVRSQPAVARGGTVT